MIDLTSYEDKKEKGLISLVKIDSDSFATSTKKFDADNGEALPDEVIGGNLIELNEKKDSLLAEIAQIDSFISDFTVLKSADSQVVDSK